MILDPSGTPIGQPIEEEGILYADIDTALSVEPKQFHDVVGYYNRFDIFDLRVDRSKREPAQFRDGIPQVQTDAPPEAETRSRTAAVYGNVVEEIGEASRRKKRP